jgi:hypothetical protein
MKHSNSKGLKEFSYEHQSATVTITLQMLSSATKLNVGHKIILSISELRLSGENRSGPREPPFLPLLHHKSYMDDFAIEPGHTK